nr:tropomyosin [Hymenolepis microstoma]
MSSVSADSLLETLKKKLLQFKTNVNALNLEYERKQELLKEERDKRDKAEAEVAALQRRIRLLEDDLESTEARLNDATIKLEEASKAADESERGCKVLENRTVADEERISSLQEQLKEFTFMAEDADRKYDESSLKLAMSEVDLERAESRLEAAERNTHVHVFIYFYFPLNRVQATQKLATAEDALSTAEKRVEGAEERIRSMEHALRSITTNLKTMELSESTWFNWQCRKILDLEDELRIVGNNMKSLEISEQEAAQREEAYEENIRDLTERLKAAEDRAQDAERLVHTLQSDADRLEGKHSVWSRAWLTDGGCKFVCMHPLHCMFLFPPINHNQIKAEKRTERAEEEMTRRQEELIRLEAELDAEKTLNASLREDMENIVAELQNL